MKRVIAVLVMLLLCSTAAFAGTSIRIGGLYGKYNEQVTTLGISTKGFGGYVGLTSYLDSIPVGFTGSYSLMMADEYTVTGSLEVEEGDSSVYEEKNNVALWKAFAGYTLPGFGVTLGGGWVSLTYKIEDLELRSLDGPAIAAFASIPVSPKFEISAEAFYAPKLEFAKDVDAIGMGGELRGSFSIVDPVGIEVGANAVRFNVKENDEVFVQDMNVFAGVKLSF